MTTLTTTHSAPSTRLRLHMNGAGSQHQSTSALAGLPSFAELQAWVQRPQAVATCFISDLYSMKALLPECIDPNAYGSRDVFMLDRFPCKMVEIVAWVAGVDHRETSMTITVDDGDGQHVLPVTVRLALETRKTAQAGTTKTQASTSSSNMTFRSAKERREDRKAAVAAEDARKTSLRKPVRTYVRKDIRVGDTVRIVGKVDEWARRRAGGELDWVRQLIVDDGSGGSVEVVDPDQQYEHYFRVTTHHQTLYSKPFSIPPVPVARLAVVSSSPRRSDLSDSIDLSSEMGSEMLSIDESAIRLRDPSKLRSSQLTDSTFRLYMLDYMTQETIRCLEEAGENVHLILEDLFPEYAESRCPDRKGKQPAAPFGISTRQNQARSATPSLHGDRRLLSGRFTHDLDPFDIASILDVPHLADLGRLVVDSEAKKDERRRRRRIKDGCPRTRDLAVEQDRVARGVDAGHWKIEPQEKRKRMEKLVAWVLRNVAEDGAIVQLSQPTLLSKSGLSYGYLPLPPQLLCPLLVPHLEAEKFVRSLTFMRKTDPRWGSGMLAEDLVRRMQSWGSEGRWERIKEWAVRDAAEWGVARGQLKAEGKGWWAVEGT